MIAHRLSTIALADEIVVLEGGRIVARGAHDELLEESALYAEIADQGPAGPGVPEPQAAGTGGGAVNRAEIVERWRATGGRGRKLRGLLILLRPYRGRTLLMLGALLLGTAAALAPPPLAKLAIDEGIVPGDLETLTWVVVAFLVSALVYWGATYAQTYLVGWVGQRALQDLRIQLFAHLQTQSVGFYSRRQAGVIISRLTNDVQALDQLVSDGIVTLFGVDADAGRHGGDPARARRRAGAAHVPRLPAARGRLARVPDRVRERLPAHAREGRGDHRVPAGEPLRHPRRAHVRAGGAAPEAVRASSTTRTAKPTCGRST